MTQRSAQSSSQDNGERWHASVPTAQVDLPRTAPHRYVCASLRINEMSPRALPVINDATTHGSVHFAGREVQTRTRTRYETRSPRNAKAQKR